MDHPVGVEEPDAGLRKVRVVNRLGPKFPPIAVTACQEAALIGVDLEIPDLEVLSFDWNDVSLRHSNLIQQPIGSSGLGYILNALGVEDLTDQTVPIEVGRACELGKRLRIQRFALRHVSLQILGKELELLRMSGLHCPSLTRSSALGRGALGPWGVSQPASAVGPEP